jgi:hypothetical protein
MAPTIIPLKNARIADHFGGSRFRHICQDDVDAATCPGIGVLWHNDPLDPFYSSGDNDADNHQMCARIPLASAMGRNCSLDAWVEGKASGGL